MTTELLRIPIRGEKLSLGVEVSRHLAHSETGFQTIDIYETEVFGKLLTLDGHVQLSTFDEFAYHEALVHVPMLSLERPKRALVIGGGDGGVIRELCKHPSLERIDMVEIDQGVIDLCREHLPEISDGAFDDPRVTVHVADAFPFLKIDRVPYDLIVMDSTDVYEEEAGGLSEQLFSHEFYQDCRAALGPNGLLVTQADNLVFCPYSLEAIQKTFASVFTKTGSYQALVPSFGGFSGFCWASNGTVVQKIYPEQVDGLGLKYLNRTTFALAFEKLPFD